MLRFYYKFCTDGTERYQLVNDKVGIQREFYTRKELGVPNTQYVELQQDRWNLSILKVIPMDVTSINGVAIKAANDHNKNVIDGLSDSRIHAREYKHLAKDIVDRLLYHGEEFLSDVNKLIETWPLPEVKIPEGTKIIG